VRDLAVIGQDPGFAGGALAQMEAFLDGARSLEREPRLVYVPHPGLSGGGSALDRIEPLRLLRGSRRIARELRGTRARWVVAALATHGLPARLAGGPYACWIGTSLARENAGRAPGLRPSRRVALSVNAPALRVIERAVLRGATRIFATSPASRAGVADAAGLAAEQVAILPIPVDTERFVPLPDEAWLSGLDRPVLAFVGRGDDPRKNLPLALEAVSLIRRRMPAATLRVIGSGAPAGGDGVERLGELPSIAAALRESALLVLPSRQEGFGIVAAEALASGVPVVATPSGGPEQLLNVSGGGRVLRGFAAAELAAATEELLADPSRLLAMRHAGRRYVEREHSVATFRSRLRDAFEQTDAA